LRKRSLPDQDLTADPASKRLSVRENTQGLRIPIRVAQTTLLRRSDILIRRDAGGNIIRNECTLTGQILPRRKRARSPSAPGEISPGAEIIAAADVTPGGLLYSETAPLIRKRVFEDGAAHLLVTRQHMMRRPPAITPRRRLLAWCKLLGPLSSDESDLLEPHCFRPPWCCIAMYPVFGRGPRSGSSCPRLGGTAAKPS